MREGFQDTFHWKREIILPLLSYSINFTSFVLSPSLNYRGRCTICEAFHSNPSLLPLHPHIFLKANCTKEQISVFSDTKEVHSLCPLLSIQKTMNEPKVTDTNTL